MAAESDDHMRAPLAEATRKHDLRRSYPGGQLPRSAIANHRLECMFPSLRLQPPHRRYYLWCTIAPGANRC